MKQTKVFSLKGGTLQVINNIVVLWDAVNDEIPIATTPGNVITDNVYTLSSTLIRTPKTDEELAEDWAKDYMYANGKQDVAKESFLAGRKSFGDKKFHLSEKEVSGLINDCLLIGTNHKGKNVYPTVRLILEQLISSLTPPIYPHTIEVYFEDGVYLWETYKAEY